MILQIKNKVGHYLKKKNEKVIGLMEDKLGEKKRQSLPYCDQRWKHEIVNKETKRQNSQKQFDAVRSFAKKMF